MKMSRSFSAIREKAAESGTSGGIAARREDARLKPGATFKPTEAEPKWAGPTVRFRVRQGKGKPT
jgi:hypothetical protein